MNPAGTYKERLVWLSRTTTDTDSGSEIESFSPAGYLWGRVEVERGRREDHTGRIVTGTDGEISLRNYPAVQPGDRLQSWDATYTVETTYRGDNEIVCEVHS